MMIDARMIRHSGIGTYLRGLLGQYQGHAFFQKHSLGLALPPQLFNETQGWGRVFSFRSPIYSLQEQMEYPFQLKRCRLWHAPHYNIPVLANQKTKLVVTIHDLIHWLFRKEFYSPLQVSYAAFFFKQVVRSAARIITVSHQTRDDLIQYFNAPYDRISVIHEGVEPDFFQVPEMTERKKVLEKYQIPESFFLYVGLIKPHKNIKRLLQVFKKLRGQEKVHSALVLVGKKDRRYPPDFKVLENLQTGHGIHYLPSVDSRAELHALYASARALIHPSLYEGFGLTCLEAMASGTPVIASSIASLPEVLGETACYIDPYSETSLAEGILRMEEEEGFCHELREKGRLRARSFSWAKAAQKTIQVYEEILG